MPAQYSRTSDFDIEVHARAEFAPPVELKQRRQRIDAKAAHGIFDLARQGIDRNPNMGQIAGPQAQRRHAVIVMRATDDQRARMRRGLFEKARNVFDPVLAVGIDLQRRGCNPLAPRSERRSARRCLCRG